jgi:hypothetical protein
LQAYELVTNVLSYDENSDTVRVLPGLMKHAEMQESQRGFQVSCSSLQVKEQAQVMTRVKERVYERELARCEAEKQSMYQVEILEMENVRPLLPSRMPKKGHIER